MAGPKKEGAEREAVVSFFGDDDLDWIDEDSDIVERSVAAEVADRAAESALQDAVTTVEMPASDADAATDAVAATDADAAAEPLPSAPRRAAVPPPPPPLYVAPAGRRVAQPSTPRGGFLDSILPHTLEPPRLATTPTPVGAGPEVVEAIGVKGSRSHRFELPRGPDAWRETVSVLEAVAREDETRRAELLVQAAWVRVRRLGDRTGALARLEEAVAAGAERDAAWHALLSDASAGTPDEGQAWAARAELLTAAARSDALRQAAGSAAGTEQERAWLAAAVEADPDDLIAGQRLASLLREADDAEALVVLLAGLRSRLDPSSVPSLDTERGALLSRLGREEEAQAAWREALAADPAHGPAWSALEASLTSAGDHASLADLYAAEAEAAPSERAFWLWRAARSAHDAGDTERAHALIRAAVEAGSELAKADQEVWLLDDGDHEGLLAAVRRTTPAALGPLVAGSARYRVAVAIEGAGGNPSIALEAYREAAELGFGPATEAVERALHAAGAHEEIESILESRVAAWDVPRAVDLIALAEAHEARDASSDKALRRYREAAKTDDLVALRGVLRVAHARGDDLAVEDALTRLAAAETDPALRAARAFALGQRALAAARGADAVRLFERAMVDGADEALALEGLSDALVMEGRAAEAATHLATRGDAVAAEACVTWLLDAARLRIGVGDVDGALAALDTLLDRVPDQAVASRLRRRIAGARRPQLVQDDLARASGDEARAALAILGIFSEGQQPVEPPGVLSDVLRDLAAARSGGWKARLSNAAVGERALARIAWAGDVAGLQVIDRAVVGASSALARVAERQGNIELAKDLADGSDLPLREQERLAIGAASTARDALAAVRRRSRGSDARVGSLVELAGIAAAAGDVDTRRRAHLAIVRRSTSPAERAAHGVWAGTLSASATAWEDAATAWRAVLEARPGSLFGLDGLRAALTHLGRIDELAALLVDDPRTLAEALDGVDDARSVEVWAALADGGGLVDRLAHEHALAAADQWDALYDAWTDRLESTTAVGERDRLEAKRRWVLAEKLAGSDRAAELYQRLHEESPDDVDVLESLARITAARGDAGKALDYLQDLLGRGPGPRDAARYQRRIAEVHEGTGDDGAARGALLDALDHDSEDLDALAALKALALRTEDWDTLVSVLNRQVALAAKGDRVAVQRELAQVCEDHLADPVRAIEAWQAVLVDNPQDGQGLEHLLELFASSGELQRQIEVGQRLAAQRTGEARSSLWSRLGLAAEQGGRRDEAVRLLEQAVGGEAPDATAAARLLDIHRAGGDHAGVVRVLRVLALLSESDLDALRFLHEAARVEVDQRHDREAAHRIHQEILRRDPEDEVSLRFLAAYLYDAQRFAEALVIHERLEPMLDGVVDVDEYDVKVELTSFYFRYGEMLRAFGRSADAITRYERALALVPTHLPTLEAVGPLYADLEDWDRAGPVYQRLLELTGGQGDAEQVANTFTMLGLVELHEGRADKAFRRFTRAIEAFPSYPAALKGLARVYEAREDWNALLQAYNNVIYHSTVPQDVVDAYLIKGRVLDIRLDRPDKAAQHYERCLSFDEGQPIAYLRLCELAMRRLAWEEAIGFARRGLAHTSEEEAPVAALLQLGVATALQHLEDHNGADQALEAARMLDASLVTSLGADGLGDGEAAYALLRERVQG